MTLLSVNLNKIALLRNSRGNDYPNLIEMGKRAVAAGARGITVHPRPDERHIKYADVPALADWLKKHNQTDYPHVEYNIEGYPTEAFIELVLAAKPDQCTLVPDDPNQLTSDHGWDVPRHADSLKQTLNILRDAGIRSALFMDADPKAMQAVQDVGADRIELYTEEYARAYGTSVQSSVLNQYAQAAQAAAELGLGVNAGHDLNLENLSALLEACPQIEEVSIGHAIMVETFDYGYEPTIRRYLEITNQ